MNKRFVPWFHRVSCLWASFFPSSLWAFEWPFTLDCSLEDTLMVESMEELSMGLSSCLLSSEPELLKKISLKDHPSLEPILGLLQWDSQKASMRSLLAIKNQEVIVFSQGKLKHLGKSILPSDTRYQEMMKRMIQGKALVIFEDPQTRETLGLFQKGQQLFSMRHHAKEFRIVSLAQF